ncbi:hypothetical protein ACJX0J_016141, partial [Zea mays]
KDFDNIRYNFLSKSEGEGPYLKIDQVIWFQIATTSKLGIEVTTTESQSWFFCHRASPATCIKTLGELKKHMDFSITFCNYCVFLNGMPLALLGMSYCLIIHIY